MFHSFIVCKVQCYYNWIINCAAIFLAHGFYTCIIKTWTSDPATSCIMYITSTDLLQNLPLGFYVTCDPVSTK